MLFRCYKAEISSSLLSDNFVFIFCVERVILFIFQDFLNKYKV